MQRIWAGGRYAHAHAAAHHLAGRQDTEDRNRHRHTDPPASFGAAETPAGQRTWPGQSVAEWQLPGGGRGRGGQRGQPGTGTLKVTTTQMRPGYIHKNGVPFSENAVLTEYFNVVSDRGLTYLADTLMLDDPRYLTQSFVRSAQFKKQADATGWEPSPCSAK